MGRWHLHRGKKAMERQSMRTYLLEDGEHGNIGLAGTRGGTHEDVLAGVQRCLANAALYPVELLHAHEGWLHPLGQLADLDQALALLEGWRLACWHKDLLVLLSKSKITLSCRLHTTIASPSQPSLFKEAGQ